MADLRPKRPNLRLTRAVRPDLKPERPDLRYERTERPEKPDLRPKRSDLRPERPDLRLERPDLRPERPDLGPEGGGRTNKQTNEQTDERKSLCVLQDFVPFGAVAQKTEDSQRRDNRIVHFTKISY